MAYTTANNTTSIFSPRSVKERWQGAEATQVTVLSPYPNAPVHTDVTVVWTNTDVPPTNT